MLCISWSILYFQELHFIPWDKLALTVFFGVAKLLVCHHPCLWWIPEKVDEGEEKIVDVTKD